MADWVEYIVLCVAAFALVSCEKVADPGPREELSLLFQVVAQQNEQRCYVFRTVDLTYRPVYEPPNSVEYFPVVEAASVHLRDSVGRLYPLTLRTDTIAARGAKKYFATPDSLTIVPGHQYFVAVRSAASAISGATTVPGDFMIKNPTQSDVLHFQNGGVSLDVAWASSRDAAGYLVLVSLFGQTYSGLRGTYIQEFTTRDTVLNRVVNSYISRPDTCTIEVRAYDRNYDNHRFKNAEFAGVQGGYGFFGSAVSRKVTVRVR